MTYKFWKIILYLSFHWIKSQYQFLFFLDFSTLWKKIIRLENIENAQSYAWLVLNNHPQILFERWILLIIGTFCLKQINVLQYMQIFLGF